MKEMKISILTCKDCPYFLKVFYARDMNKTTAAIPSFYCTNPVHGDGLHRKIGEPTVIPLWCPLPNTNTLLTKSGLLAGHAEPLDE